MRYPYPDNNGLNSVTWTGNLAVAVGKAGTILTSADEIAWTHRKSGIANELIGVKWTGNQVIAFGNNGTILTSKDGFDWSLQNSGTNVTLNDVVWADSLFIMVGDSGTILTSPNGVTWTKKNSVTSSALTSIAWNGKIAVAIGHEDMNGSKLIILTSTNGTIWTYKEMLYMDNNSNIVWGNNRFEIVYSFMNLKSISSTDGVEWSGLMDTLYPVETMRNLIWTGNYFLGVCGSTPNSKIYTSNDGHYWRYETDLSTSNELFCLNGLVWAGTSIIAVGNNLRADNFERSIIFTSPDAKDWKERSKGSSVKPQLSLCKLDSIIIVTGMGIGILSNGLNWSPGDIVLDPSNLYLKSITWAADQFVAVGEKGKVYISPDGITYTARSSGITADLNGITWNGKTVITVGNNGLISTSPDAAIWTNRTSHTTRNLKGIASTDSQAIAVGDSGTILLAANGLTWSGVNSGTISNLNAVAYTGNQYVVAGNNGTILLSQDGTNWKSCSTQTTYSLRAITGDTNSILVVGDSGTILFSPDGIAWKKQNSGTRDNLLCATLTNNGGIVFGEGGTVLTTADVTNIDPPTALRNAVKGSENIRQKIQWSITGKKLKVMNLNRNPAVFAQCLLFTLSGKCVARSSSIRENSRTVEMDIPVSVVGIYVLVVQLSNEKLSRLISISN
jgi:hypothetical protein